MKHFKRVLKELAKYFDPVVTHLFQQIMDTGESSNECFLQTFILYTRLALLANTGPSL